MTHRKILLTALLTLGLVPVPAPGFAWYGSRLLDVAAGETLPLAHLVPRLASSTLVFFGEIHSQPKHHELELRLARALAASGTPVALGLEMIQAADQPILDAWVAGRLPESALAAVFEANWPGTWGLYRPLFYLARRNGIPVLGLNIPDAITRKVAARGFFSLTAEELAQLPGVSCDVSPRYMAMIRKAIAMHGPAGSRFSLERFCEAQMVWDSTMAWRLVEFTRRHPDTVVLVIAGNTHAWKHGIPAQVAVRDPDLEMTVILPEIPRVQEPGHLGPDDVDYLWRWSFGQMDVRSR